MENTYVCESQQLTKAPARPADGPGLGMCVGEHDWDCSFSFGTLAMDLGAMPGGIFSEGSQHTTLPGGRNQAKG